MALPGLLIGGGRDFGAWLAHEERIRWGGLVAVYSAVCPALPLGTSGKIAIAYYSLLPTLRAACGQVRQHYQRSAFDSEITTTDGHHQTSIRSLTASVDRPSSVDGERNTGSAGNLNP